MIIFGVYFYLFFKLLLLFFNFTILYWFFLAFRMFTFRLTLWVSTGVDTAWMHCDATHLTQWRPGFSYMNLLPLWHHQRILKSVFTREIGLLFSWSVLVWLWYQGDGASQVALMVKNQCRRHERQGFYSWVGKIPWRRKWHATPEFLPGEFHEQRSLVGYSPLGHKQSDMTEWLKQHQGNAGHVKWVWVWYSFTNCGRVWEGLVLIVF